MTTVSFNCKLFVDLDSGNFNTFEITLPENTVSLLDSLKQTLLNSSHSSNDFTQLDCYAYFLDDNANKSKYHITTDDNVRQAIKYVRDTAPNQKDIYLYFVKTYQFVPVI
jgi:hypothetical protein